ncbi:polysaccharide biosynthesis protein [Thiohalobacter sp. IOR34]|uniref:polysaccharide biosynthesis protein n=1 Tax=Thiohalobacter sp. IOR34 TaxID=3057176 RepID=UPI0025B1E0B0|nr:polysaccharide biosynthesis protein [Thiohalobacter sp. IOR34]WJW76698.1 polysaccharide biosynthesis protein [Thiohalobacter sp. IOR34]
MNNTYDPDWENKNVLITGVCGTVGKELLRQVVARQPARVVGIDNNESEVFFLSQEYTDNPNVRLFIGDIRDKDKLIRKMRGIDIVLHAAALKHVILCEESPRDAIQSNIIGTQNIIDAAQLNNVERVLFTSSDKAVNPTNVMGTSKLMGERLMTAANALRHHDRDPVFASSRFGNVLGSRGSVIPLFKRQIASGGPVTLTSREMTRFIMTLEQAVSLVIQSVFFARGGEVFVTKMPVVRIEDLAQVMIEELAPKYGYDAQQIEINVIGPKSGEKLFEELMNEEETRRTVELQDFFVVLPAFKCIYEEIEYKYPNMTSTGIENPYNSSVEDSMPKEELREYLISNKLLEG